ncbi:MAG TPA: DUF927 domain-containing protein, partial [Magnetococcales bacterium]|nr:DUF927 domain-containing protein [Magnetococcales bacterium]
MVKENENKGSEPFWVDKAGLWCLSPGDDSPVWLSAPLSVIGRSRNNIGEGHGLLVAWNDPDGKRKEWVMPLEMLADDGKEMRKGLLNRGLRMATSLKARRRFLAWIANQRPKKTWIVTRDQGWNGHSYVLPDGVIGFSQDPIILEGWDSEKEEIQVSGELEEWIENVSLPCLGHRKLMISLIAAFAGPMMYWTSEENFGLHFHGGSSIGKTTTLYVAQSVWGGPRGLQRWRSTANALETVASGRNDRLLCLDEIAQLDPRMAGEVAYMLGNGKGKHRALKDGSKAKEKSWRLVYLSSGEISLSEFVETNGGIMRGGMGVRQIDIRAEEGENGILGKMEGDEKPADFISRLVGSTRFLFGTAGRAFAFEVSKDPHEHVDFVESYRTKFLEIFEKDIKNGQSRRVCEKFG